MYTIAQICERDSLKIKLFKRFTALHKFYMHQGLQRFLAKLGEIPGFCALCQKNSLGLPARFNTILMRGKIEEFSPLENISKTNLIFLTKKNIVGIHFDFILPETFFGHIIHSVNDPAVLTHSGKYHWINPINDHLTTPLISAIRVLF